MFHGTIPTVAAYFFMASVQGSVLIGLLLAGRLAFGRGISPRLWCVLWLVACLRLLTGLAPIALHLPAARQQGDASAFDAGARIPADVRFTVRNVPAVLPAATTGALSSAATSTRLDLPRLCGWLWFFGLVFWIGRLLISHVRLQARIRRMPGVTDPTICGLLDACRSDLGIARAARLVHSDDLRTPAVAGFLRPVLILPSRLDLSPKDLRNVFLHELAHVRRHDFATEVFVAVVRGFHWFNPLVHLADRAYRTDRELACDGVVLAALGEQDRPTYGQSLVRILTTLSTGRPHPATIGLFGARYTLAARIRQITAAGKPSLALSIGAIMLFGCAAGTTVKPASRPAEPAMAESVDHDRGTARAESELRKTTTRVYDVRALLTACDADPDHHFSKAASQPAIAAQDKARLDDLAALIHQMVDPLSWRDVGGAFGSTTVRSGEFIVTQSDDNQRRIADLIQELIDGRRIVIGSQLRLLKMDGGTAGGPLGRYADRFLTAEEVRDLIKSTGGSATLLAAPRFFIFNGQRATISMLNEVPYISGFNIIKKNGDPPAYDPIIKTVSRGVTFDVQGMATADRRSVSLNVDLKLRSADLVPEAVEGQRDRAVQKPAIREKSFHQVMSIPAGRSLLVSTHLTSPEGYTLSGEAADASASRAKGGHSAIYLLVTPDIVKPAGGDDR